MAIKDIRLAILKELNKKPEQRVNIAPLIRKILENGKILRPTVAHILVELKEDKQIDIPDADIDKITTQHAGVFNNILIEGFIKPKGIDFLKEERRKNSTRVFAIYGAVLATIVAIAGIIEWCLSESCNK